MLVMITWLWGDNYGAADVSKLRAGVRRNLKQDHRFICVTDKEQYFSAGIWSRQIVDGVPCVPIVDRELTAIKGCFARLRMFDPQWQSDLGIMEGDRVVCMDLDSVVTGDLDPLFNRPERFMILQGANAANPCPFNGSLMMLRAGAYPEVWSEFSLEKARSVPFYEFPDDQGWLWHMLPKASGWKVGSPSGVYAFQKPGWPKGDALPADACLVVFPGWRSPSKFAHLGWVKEHWRVDVVAQEA